MNNPKIAKFYRGVPAKSLQRLQEFRQRYPYQSRTIRGHEWRFIDTGEGEEVLVVMAGGTSIAEVSFQSLAHFAEQCRVIAPDYPPIGNISELFEGLISLLDDLGVGQFSLMGGSYGGWIPARWKTTLRWRCYGLWQKRSWIPASSERISSLCFPV